MWSMLFFTLLKWGGNAPTFQYKGVYAEYLQVGFAVSYWKIFPLKKKKKKQLLYFLCNAYIYPYR